MQYFQVGENDKIKRRIYLHLVDATDGITPETGEAGNTAKVSLNGNTPTTSMNSLVAIDTTNQPGTYYLELSTNEIQFPGIVSVRYKSADTAEFVTLGQIMAFDPYTQFGTLGGGGGVDVDYKRIQKIVDESVGSIPKPTNPKEPDLVPISEGLQAILTAIRAIKLPEIPQTDLRPIERQIESLERIIKGIEIPVTDLSQTNRLIQDQNAVLDQLAEVQEEIKSFHLDDVKKFFESGIDRIRKAVETMNQKFDNTQMVILKNEQVKEETKPSVLDEYLNLP